MWYICKICGEYFSSEKEQLFCESRPVLYDNAEIGDTVKILNGYCTGKFLKVDKKWVIKQSWDIHPGIYIGTQLRLVVK